MEGGKKAGERECDAGCKKRKQRREEVKEEE